MIIETLKTFVSPVVRRRLKGSYYHLREVADGFFGDGALIPPAYARDYVGDGDFVQLGDLFAGYFRQRGDLRPTERILDVGSGIGRMALPLTRYLSSEAQYDGFDVAPYGVQWSQRQITKRFPQFRFHLFDLKNSAYNPHGRHDPVTFSFPFPDASFDFAFATSVFTHLTGPVAENYLREIARCLAPGGRCVLTFFLLNDKFRASRERGKARYTFEHRGEGEGCFVQTPDNVDDAVAYEETRVFSWLEQCGLTIHRPVDYGTWAGYCAGNGVSTQDLILARKA